MGQVFVPTPQSLILSATDRLVASNADGGLNVNASHIILMGENAGQNLGAVTNFIVLGNNSLKGGLVSLTENGSNVIGGQILSALTDATAPVQRDGAFQVIGFNCFPLVADRFGAVVAIGSNIGALMPADTREVSANVYIGNDVVGQQRTRNVSGGLNSFNVIIGDRAGRGVTTTVNGAGVNFSSSVIIGAEACENSGFDAVTPGTSIATTVAIGRQALRSAAAGNAKSVQATVAIGNLVASAQTDGLENVYIGSGLTVQPSGQQGNVFIGANLIGTTAVNAVRNVAIGGSISLNNLQDLNTLVGFGCNGLNELPATASNRLLVQTYDGATVRTLLYGLASNASPAGLIVGNSISTNRDVPGFNILKLINGSKTGVAPVGGGFFYGTGAGLLHWVDTNNNDYNLTLGSSLGTVTVAGLAALTPGAGSRAYVTDALAPAFGAAVAGGGAVFIPVFFNGAAWIVG